MTKNCTSTDEPIRIKRTAGLHFFVPCLEQERDFLVGVLDFAQIATSGDALEARAGQRSAVFQAGACTIICSEPLVPESQSGRFLRLHPRGVGAILLDVDDAEQAFTLLEARGGTPLGPIERDDSVQGGLSTFQIATPANDVLLQFVERADHPVPLPGFVPSEPRAALLNRCCIRSYDHVTFNFQTLTPTALWLERLLHFQPLWSIRLHTEQPGANKRSGSGFRSVVSWHERSGVKFALNEPLPPNFEASQIYRFCEDQRGSGVQHAALEVDDMVQSVARLRQRGARFIPAPKSYYERLPDRLEQLGLRSIDEDLRVLEELGILVDGEGPGRYLLQIFMDPSQPVRGEAVDSPFFFEVIQRKGDRRFGDGNVRALFEGIESTQCKESVL